MILGRKQYKPKCAVNSAGQVKHIGSQSFHSFISRVGTDSQSINKDVGWGVRPKTRSNKRKEEKKKL